MKKEKIIATFFISLGVIFVFSLEGLAQTKIELNKEEISNLQKILKEFPEIYPEGYVTGYYGPLTQRAIKKLQAKCKLPETGIVNEATLKCLFPIVKIQVLFPNGGEVLDRNQIQTIKWKVEFEPKSEPFSKERIFWRKASIDLLKKVPDKTQSIFVKHIGTVDLLDTEYYWRITPDIPNGPDYIIRISTGFKILPLIEGKEEIKILPPKPPRVPPYWEWNFDESDGTFTITGETKKLDFSETIKILEEISKNLEKIINDLKRVIELLKAER